MVSSIGSSGSAALQNIQQRQSSFFKKMDSDGSGGLSIDEFSAMVANAPSDAPKIDDTKSSFSSMDTNGDGSLSQSELQTGMQSLMEASQSTVSKFGGSAPPDGPPPPPSDASSAISDGSSSTDSSDVLSQLLSALSNMNDGTSAPSSSSSSSSSDSSSSSSTTSTDSAAAMAQKLSKMFEQMATAFASFGVQNGSAAADMTASTNSVSLTA